MEEADRIRIDSMLAMKEACNEKKGLAAYWQCDIQGTFFLASVHFQYIFH